MKLPLQLGSLLAAGGEDGGGEPEALQKKRPSVAPPETRPNVAAPDFELPTIQGEPFRLAEATERGYVLLVFIRGMW